MAMAALLFAAMYAKKSKGYLFAHLSFLQLVLELLLNHFHLHSVSATGPLPIYANKEIDQRRWDPGNMRVKLSSLHPSQLLPNFRTEQYRLRGPEPGVQLRAIQASFDTGSPGPLSPNQDSPPGFPSHNNGKSGAEKESKVSSPNFLLQSNQGPSGNFRNAFPQESIVEPIRTNVVSDAVLFKAPLPPGPRNVSPQHSQMPLSSDNRELGELPNSLRTQMQPNSSPMEIRPVPSTPIQTLPYRNEFKNVPPPDFMPPSQSTPPVSPVPIEVPQTHSPVPIEVPRSPSPLSQLSPLNFHRSGSPEIEIIKDNRPLPPFKTIQSKPFTYVVVPYADGTLGYKIDGTDFSHSFNGYQGFPRILTPPYSPMQSSPEPFQKPNTITRPPSPFTQSPPISNYRGQVSQAGSLSPQQTQHQLPMSGREGSLRFVPQGAAINNGYPHNSQPSNAQLRSENAIKNQQFHRDISSPFSGINPGEPAHQRSQFPPMAITGDHQQETSGPMNPNSRLPSSPQTQNTLGLRDYLSAPPLTAMSPHQQQLPVRTPPAKDTINSFPNGLTEKTHIFPQSPTVVPEYHPINQNSILPYSQGSQNILGKAAPLGFQQGPPNHNVFPERARTPGFPETRPPPPYPYPQPRPTPIASARQDMRYGRYPLNANLQGTQPDLRRDHYQNDQRRPAYSGRFVDQNPNNFQQSYRQPLVAQQYRRLQPAPFQETSSPTNQLRLPPQNSPQENYERQNQGRARQRERKQELRQRVELQRQLLQTQENRNENLGNFRQIPPTGYNQAGGHFQQLQPALPPRQNQNVYQRYPYPNPHSPIQGQPISDGSQTSHQPYFPYTRTPSPAMGYGGPQFSSGFIPNRGQAFPPAQAPQHPPQRVGLRPYEADGQIGQIKAMAEQRPTATSTSGTIPQYKPKPVNTVSDLHPTTGNNNVQTQDNSIQPTVRPFPQYPPLASNNERRGPTAGANQFDAKTTGFVNGSSQPGTQFLGEQPVLHTQAVPSTNTSNNRVPVFSNVDTDAQSRTNAGPHEIPTGRLPYSQALKGPQDSSPKNTQETTPSILPHHRGEMPFYSQSQIDNHHRRLLANNKTKEDLEFESDSKILQWYLQRAKQVLRHQSDNVNSETQQTSSKQNGNDVGPSNGNPNRGVNALPLAGTSASNADSKLPSLSRTASANSNSANGAGQSRKPTGSETSATATSSANNSGGLSNPSGPLPANILQQPTAAVSKEKTDLKRKHRAVSLKDLYNFMKESMSNNNIQNSNLKYMQGL